VGSQNHIRREAQRYVSVTSFGPKTQLAPSRLARKLNWPISFASQTLHLVSSPAEFVSVRRKPPGLQAARHENLEGWLERARVLTPKLIRVSPRAVKGRDFGGRSRSGGVLSKRLSYRVWPENSNSLKCLTRRALHLVSRSTEFPLWAGNCATKHTVDAVDSAPDTLRSDSEHAFGP